MRQSAWASNPCGEIRHNVQKEVQRNGSNSKLRDRNDRFNEVLFDFESTAEFPAELDRIFKITEGVMRSLIIKKEDE